MVPSPWADQNPKTVEFGVILSFPHWQETFKVSWSLLPEISGIRLGFILARGEPMDANM